MPGNEMLQAVGHAVAVPGAEPQVARKSQARAAAETDIAPAVSHEAPDLFRTR